VGKDVLLSRRQQYIGLRISRVAVIEQESWRAETAFQNSSILRPHSGVGWMGGLGGSVQFSSVDK